MYNSLASGYKFYHNQCKKISHVRMRRENGDNWKAEMQDKNMDIWDITSAYR